MCCSAVMAVAGPPALSQKAQEAAERALQLGGGLAEAHTVLGAVRTDRDWDWLGAETEYRQALRIESFLSNRAPLVQPASFPAGKNRRGRSGNSASPRS